MPAEAIDDLGAMSEAPPHIPENAGLWVMFDIKAVKNVDKSKEAGRPIFDKVEYIHKMVPGDKTLEVHKPASEQDKIEFRRAYLAFKAGENQDTAGGTPLSMWPLMDVATIEELKFFKVFTVEQLAMAPETSINKMGPGFRKMQQQAKDWLESARSSEPMERLRSENEELKSRMEVLERAIAEMKSEASEKKPKKADKS